MSPSRASGLRRGRPGRPAMGGMPSTKARVWVTSLTLAAVVMTLSGVPRPSHLKWCLLPAFRRSTGDGPMSAPPFSRERGNHPRTPVTSRVHRPRSASRAGPGGAGRRRRPSATGPDAANRSVRSRTPAPRAGVARLCRCRGRTGCPGGRDRSNTGLGPGDRSGQGGSSGSISAHKSSSTIHGRVLTPSRTVESAHRSRPTGTAQQDRVTSSKRYLTCTSKEPDCPPERPYRYRP